MKKKNSKASDQEEMAYKTHGFELSQCGHGDHSWFHLLMLEGWPGLDIP